jgi:hypothetical protein
MGNKVATEYRIDRDPSPGPGSKVVGSNLGQNAYREVSQRPPNVKADVFDIICASATPTTRSNYTELMPSAEFVFLFAPVVNNVVLST